VETKANFVLIGAFALAGLLGILGFFLWFARVELDRQFAYYDIRFASVSGLSNASDVRFSGLPVGQVVDVRLTPTRDGTVTVRVEVDAETPVRTDSVATIEALGVTGVSFVSIGPGSPDAPFLEPTSEDPTPEITAGRSTLQTLTEDAPSLVSETLQIVEDIGLLFSDENAERIERILANVDQASEEFAATIEAFGDVAGTIDGFAQQISFFNETLDALTTEMNTVLATADDTLASVTALADEATVIVQNGSGTVSALQAVMTEAQLYIAEDLSQTTNEAREMIATLRGEATEIGDEAGALIATLQETGTTATDRLREAEATLGRADALIATLNETAGTIDAAARRIDGLIETEGAPLLAETRAAVASATETIAVVRAAAETDLPMVLDDVADAARTARETLVTVGNDLTEASGDVSGLVASAERTLAQVTETFGNANETLAAINGAMATGERTLALAEGALTGADELIRGDLGALVGDLRTTLEGLDEAVATVADDLPATSADIRAASAAALAAFADLQGIVANSSPGIQDFTTNALPLFGQLARETRTLITNLDQLTRQINRSPTRFLLDRDLPEFRR
jgi:phospholipid/cholesterol/gamma-HCH transport system substrate-binding protein